MIVQETRQTIGKTTFVVVSNFKTSGRFPQDNLSALIHRDVQENSRRIIDTARKARYTDEVSVV